MDRVTVTAWINKYKYVLIVLLAGICFMLLPESSRQTAEAPPVETSKTEDMETRLELILGQIQGAGEVAVMLTEAAGENIIYQSDGEGGETVLITDAQRNEQGLVRTREPPVFRGAIVVCTGADSAGVRLALAEAVADVTGLGMDRITVLKMK